MMLTHVGKDLLEPPPRLSLRAGDWRGELRRDKDNTAIEG